jgi:hypothetical protein
VEREANVWAAAAEAMDAHIQECAREKRNPFMKGRHLIGYMKYATDATELRKARSHPARSPKGKSAMTRDQIREKAKEIRLDLEKTGRYGPVDAVDPHDGSVQSRVEGLLESALLSMLPPKGSIMTEEGVVKRIAGPENACLPTLGDGSLWVTPSYVWTHDDKGEPYELCVEDAVLSYNYKPGNPRNGWWDFPCGDGDVALSSCYSTREAASAAQAARTGGSDGK